MAKKEISEDKQLLHCSFCRKSNAETRKLIEGPGVYICNACVELCTDIIKEEIKPSAEKESMAVIGTEEIELTASALRLAVRGYSADAIFIVREKTITTDN